MKAAFLSVIRISVLAVTTALFCTQTRASVLFTPGNHPQPDEENILLNSGATGPSVQGTANLSGIPVLFSSTTDTLSEPSSGQARIEAASGLLNNISISVPGGSFTDLIINPSIDGPAGVPGGTANVSVVANEPGGGTTTATFNYTLGNGNNFLTIIASGGETLASVTIDSDLGFPDLAQPRISGAALAPDGGSTLTLLGAALAGLSLARRRARNT